MNDFLINRSVPVFLRSNMLTVRDSQKSSNSDGDLLKTTTYYHFNDTHSNPQDHKQVYKFGKEMKFDIDQIRRKSNRNKRLIKILNSLATMASDISFLFFTRKS